MCAWNKGLVITVLKQVHVFMSGDALQASLNEFLPRHAQNKDGERVYTSFNTGERLGRLKVAPWLQFQATPVLRFTYLYLDDVIYSIAFLEVHKFSNHNSKFVFGSIKAFA